MKKRCLLLALIFLVPAAGFSSPTEPVCMLQENSITQRLNLNQTPGFFAKVFAQQKLVGFATASDVPYIGNLDTGVFYTLPGSYDVVPSPDELFVTTAAYAGYIRWFLTSEILNPSPSTGLSQVNSWRTDTKEDAEFRRAEEDEEIAEIMALRSWQPDTSGANTRSFCYQSIGVLANLSTDLKRTYRLLADGSGLPTLAKVKGGLVIRNETFEFKNKNDTNPKFTETPWIPLCPNINAILKLPMISKDGKFLSCYNVSSGKTEIYEVADSGNCTLKKQLPFATAKADFSFDNSKIAFHHKGGGDSQDWFTSSKLNDKINVYVLDLKTDKFTRVSNQYEGNAYYPTFRKDGSIGFLEQVPNGNKPAAFSYVLADPNLGAEVPLPGGSKQGKQGFSFSAALGALWMQVCHPKDAGTLSNNNLSFLAAGLPGDQCRDLVARYWEQHKVQLQKQFAMAPVTANPVKDSDTMVSAKEIAEALEELPADAIADACSGIVPQNAPLPSNTVNSGNLQGQTETPVELFQHTCSPCHGAGQSPAFDFANPLSISKGLRQLMAKKILSDSMPPDGGLSDEQKKELADFLTQP